MSGKMHGNQLRNDSINIGGSNNKLNPDGSFDMGTHGLKTAYIAINDDDITNYKTIRDNTALIKATIADVELLNSEYKFVFCEETGKVYHYESTTSLIANNDTVLNTVDGSASKFVSISGGIKIYKQSLNVLDTSGDNSMATTSGLSYTPINDTYVSIYVNGRNIEITGDKLGSCYFSSDGGTTAKTIENLEKGDILYWNGLIAGFDLENAYDKIFLTYNINI
jgi:hypothetical protein